jgi:hypothetical protein
MIDENPPHQLGGYAVKVRSILPDDTFLADQFQVRLMNERCWLKRVVRPFVPKIG